MEEEKFESLQEVLADRLLKEIKDGDKLEVGSNERSKNAENVKLLMQAYCENDKRVTETYLDEKRLDLEEKKIVSPLAIEKIKKELDWKHLAIEAAKIGVPFITALMYVLLYRESRDIAGKFEETGRYTTEVGRKTSLPNIFNWR